MTMQETNTGSNGVPLLPLRDIVIFPFMVTPLFVARDKSIRALEEAMEGEKLIFLATQEDPQVDEPSLDDVYEIGTLANIVQLLKLPDGTLKVLVEGQSRGRIDHWASADECIRVEFTELSDAEVVENAELEALLRSVCELFETYVSLSKKIPAEVAASVSATQAPGRLSDTVAAHLSLRVDEKQELLALVDPIERLERLITLLAREVEILEIEKKIRSRVKGQMERSQKEYYLNEQMRAIQKELGESDEFKIELKELEDRIQQASMTKDAQERAMAELRKLRMMSPTSAEATVVRNYVDWLASVPWKKKTRDRRDMVYAEKILEADHYGLEKVKERILEYLAVQALVKKIKGPILCLVGPPGVGKTSLGKSIARALGRKFARISLGGLRDEAEIRGHRRTYIGAMPGKIVQNMRKVAVKNPVFLLDEIDKVSSDFRGDPSSALLEVLDPEQNGTFGDHYMEVEYDLSDVMFIATANSMHSIARPLLDRMEVIRIEGYTEDEKVNIAQKYLVEKQIKAHGLNAKGLNFQDSAIYAIIRSYTREAGVRNLEREIANICRKVARQVVLSKGKKVEFNLDADAVKEFLGVPRYEHGIKEEDSCVGMATGLAWTEVGGELLTIETSILPGHGKLTVTGKLGEVMQESAKAALSYIRSRWEELQLEKDFYHKIDIHIHVPEGAIPKDGPSAGITMATALASALTGREVDRNLAMTGEITLRGRVLPIGGLKEKLLAAKRAGITRVLIPAENKKNLEDVPETILSALEVLPVSHMDEVLEQGLKMSSPLASTSTVKDQSLGTDGPVCH
ncbi:ATP-dependent Lon protease (La) [Syntrophotalea carbinolica DSM 2380]|uniref:Lon protease n=1 Tax=Syntrophotalea carbinolica (strain DSM 2380 / NBRC 103641 / GraBd1) TaxID=338963 RepID=Q3A3X7_SYNC1|nr:endopeptidase La [Syntrophotalea carbinolica]ABA88930.1 ATP-dependent Lon protease (La) [Syntrophotalea carbinolica DSM 2380]